LGIKKNPSLSLQCCPFFKLIYEKIISLNYNFRKFKEFSSSICEYTVNKMNKYTVAIIYKDPSNCMENKVYKVSFRPVEVFGRLNMLFKNYISF